MKSLKNLLLAKSIMAAAVAGSGIAAPTVSHALAVFGPSSGMVCRAGYTAVFSGTNLTCKKFGSITTPLMCDQANFPTYVNRDGTGPNGNKDICLRPKSSSLYVDIPSTGALPAGGYVFAIIDTAEAARRVIKAGQDEAAALGLQVSDVQTVQSITFSDVNPNGAVKDMSYTHLNHYTFAIPAGGPIVVSNPGPVTPATPFTPRSLP